METSRKIKYSGIDRLILGIAYVLLGLFVFSFLYLAYGSGSVIMPG